MRISDWSSDVCSSDLHTKSVAFVMAHQVLDVFKKKGIRALGVNNSRHIEKQGSLCFVGKTVGSAQGVLLAYPSDGEGLTRKARKQDIVVGDVVFIHLRDVAFQAVGGIREVR